ncbi:MAG: hypothetical protein AAFO94_11965, partial [Bacteroidota bacterium]
VKEKDWLIVGVELDIEGNGSHLYFQPELGAQHWKPSSVEDRKYIVAMGTQVPKIPDGIYRKDFYRKVTARRIVSASALRDTSYRIHREAPMKQHLEFIKNSLDEYFKLNLQRALT